MICTDMVGASVRGKRITQTLVGFYLENPLNYTSIVGHTHHKATASLPSYSAPPVLLPARKQTIPALLPLSSSAYSIRKPSDGYFVERAAITGNGGDHAV